MHDGSVGARRDVVAVERDVEVPERHLGVEQLGEPRLQALREERAATMDADERGRRRIGVALGDLVSDAHQRATHLALAQDDLLGTAHSFLSGLTGPG